MDCLLGDDLIKQGMNILEQLEDQVNCYEVVKVCVEDIFQAFDRALQEEEVSRLEVPMAVNLAMAKIETMVKLATLRYDGLCLATEPFELMEADPEPAPPAADAWARGTGKLSLPFLPISSHSPHTMPLPFILIALVLLSCVQWRLVR